MDARDLAVAKAAVEVIKNRLVELGYGVISAKLTALPLEQAIDLVTEKRSYACENIEASAGGTHHCKLARASDEKMALLLGEAKSLQERLVILRQERKRELDELLPLEKKRVMDAIRHALLTLE